MISTDLKKIAGLSSQNGGPGSLKPKTLFLAFCEVSETPYMNDTKKYKKTHLVIADDESDAEFKLKRHYRNMCSS
ncbi:hypothetical protein, partial [Salmonella enterica]|uniref:hypothetical protein n=1 Tax=Salmonella enterica TaxID=28901 RepID=UPI003D2D0635